MLLSIRTWDAPELEVDTVAEDRLLPRGGADGKRWAYQTERDDRLFEAGWFADFRAAWREALKREHLNFAARMEAIQ